MNPFAMGQRKRNSLRDGTFASYGWSANRKLSKRAYGE
jgi:hypothetical protein